MRVAGCGGVVPTVHTGRRHVGDDAIVEGTCVRAKRLGRREHKRETDQQCAQPSPGHFNLKTSTWGLRLEGKAPLEVPNTMVTAFDPAGVAI